MQKEFPKQGMELEDRINLTMGHGEEPRAGKRLQPCSGPLEAGQFLGLGRRAAGA
jgi:hypothetical protein